MIQDILSFLGLSHNPFPVALDPDSYYQTEASKVFLEELVHGIESRKGFLVLIGDVGVGKTSLSLQLLRLLEDKDIATAWVFNTVFSRDELFVSILKDWGLELGRDVSGPELLDAIHEFLLARNKAGENCVIIIDEAHNLDPACLEGLRMLSNLEFNGQKLVQILLIGQDELKLALDDHRMRQLKSRIAIYLELPSLTREEVQGYVNFKLAKADSQLRLDKGALSILWRASGGNLRRVNIIMERVLYACITLRSNRITTKAMKMAVSDVAVHQKDVARGLGHRKLGWALTACLFLGLCGGAAAAWLHAKGRFDNVPAEAAVSRPEAMEPIRAATPVPEAAMETTPATTPEAGPTPVAAPKATPENASKAMAAPTQTPPAPTTAESQPGPNPFTAPLDALGLGALADQAARAAGSGSIRDLSAALPGGYTAFGIEADPGPGESWAVLPWRETAGTGPEYAVVWRTDRDFSSVYPGSKGSNIKSLQRILARAGLYDGPLDGIYGKKAWYGLAEFQKKRGLPATGLPDAATMFELEHRPEAH